MTSPKLPLRISHQKINEIKDVLEEQLDEEKGNEIFMQLQRILNFDTENGTYNKKYYNSAYKQNYYQKNKELYKIKNAENYKLRKEKEKNIQVSTIKQDEG
jgi:hypothetical protein